MVSKIRRVKAGTRGKIRDSQRSKVYKWEFTIRELDSNLNEQLTLPQAQELTDKAWQRYYPKGPSPRVLIRNGHGNSFYKINSHTITLRPSWGVIPTVILHEVAHAITIATHGLTVAMHGAEFMGYMLELWNWYSGTSFVRQAQSSKLKVVPARLKPTAKRSAKLKPAKTIPVAKVVKERQEPKRSPIHKFKNPTITAEVERLNMPIRTLKDFRKVYLSLALKGAIGDTWPFTISEYEAAFNSDYSKIQFALLNDHNLWVCVEQNFYEMVLDMYYDMTYVLTDFFIPEDDYNLDDAKIIFRKLLGDKGFNQELRYYRSQSRRISDADNSELLEYIRYECDSLPSTLLETSGNTYAFVILTNLINRKLNGRYTEEDDHIFKKIVEEPTLDLLSPSGLIPEALSHLRSHTDTDSGWFETDIDILKTQLDKTRTGLTEKLEGRSQFCSPHCLKCTDPIYEQTKYLKTYKEGQYVIHNHESNRIN